MASQRHRMIVRNYGAACTPIAEKQPAAGYLRQQPGPYTVPVGPAGGPLQGSSLAGPIPVSVTPVIEHPLLLLTGLALAASQQPPEPPAAEPEATPDVAPEKDEGWV